VTSSMRTSGRKVNRGHLGRPKRRSRSIAGTRGRCGCCRLLLPFLTLNRHAVVKRSDRGVATYNLDHAAVSIVEPEVPAGGRTLRRVDLFVTTTGHSWSQVSDGARRGSDPHDSLGGLIGLVVLGFLAVAVLSLVMTRTPVTPAFARRCYSTSMRAASSGLRGAVNPLIRH
jgi:hypothetical protein